MVSCEARIPFKVIHCSSYDDRTSTATVLEQVHPQSQGWIAARYCTYPQELTLELERPVRIKQIQILSHQCLISTRIELYVGCKLGAYTRLGYMSLDPNRRSAYKARELKTVDLQIQTDTKFVQLVLHKNHDNDMNLYGQIGLIAINVLGERVDKRDPADLSVDVECDPHTARLIRLLHERKKQSIEEEDFDQAKELKNAIELLRKVGSRLAVLEAEKIAAVEIEDYDKAKAIKIEMDRIRREHGNSTLPPPPKPIKSPAANYCRTTFPIKLAPSVSTPAPPGQASSVSPESSLTVFSYDDRPLPALSKKPIHEPDNAVNPFGDRGAVNSQVSETAALDSVDPSLLDPEPLSESEKTQYAALIKSFGEPVVTLLLSKKAFQHRINALDEIEGILSGSISGKKVYVDLVSSALSAVGVTLPDAICQVSIRSMCLIETLINKLFPNMLLNEIQECIDPIMSLLLSLLDGSLGRQRDKARHIFDLLVGYPSVIGRYVMRPLKNAEAYKPLLGRVELLTVLVNEHGLSDESHLRLDPIINNFALPALRHKKDSMRQAGMQLAVALHNCVGDVLLPYLEGVVNAKLETSLRKTFTEKQMLQNQHPSNGSSHSFMSMPTVRNVSPGVLNHKRNSPRQRHRENANGVYTNEPDHGDHLEFQKLYDDVEDESICRFCGKQDPEFTQEESIDVHYWRQCPMLVSCKLCEQVVEIPTLVDHLLNECEKMAQVVLCEACHRPLCGDQEVSEHEESCPGPQPDVGDRNQCPLCFSIIGAGEDGWREHLLEGSGCIENTRKPSNKYI